MHKCYCTEVMPPLRHDGPTSTYAEPRSICQHNLDLETSVLKNHTNPLIFQVIIFVLKISEFYWDNFSRLGTDAFFSFYWKLILPGNSNESFLAKLSLVILLRSGVAEYTVLSLQSALYFSMSEREEPCLEFHLHLSGHKPIWKARK